MDTRAAAKSTLLSANPHYGRTAALRIDTIYMLEQNGRVQHSASNSHEQSRLKTTKAKRYNLARIQQESGGRAAGVGITPFYDP